MAILNENGFKWGSIYSEREYQWKSKDGEEAKENGYRYLALVLEMMELATKQPDDARKYLQGIDLEIFARNLGEVIVGCKDLLKQIEREQRVLSFIREFVPPSPVSYTSASINLGDF